MNLHPSVKTQLKFLRFNLGKYSHWFMAMIPQKYGEDTGVKTSEKLKTHITKENQEACLTKILQSNSHTYAFISFVMMDGNERTN